MKTPLQSASNWLILVCLAAIAFGATVCLRMLEFPAWNHPWLMVNGEFLMGTHDAYAWLAGAKGAGIMAGKPLSNIAAFLSHVSGLSLGNVGFFTPPVAGALVAVVLVLWAWLLGGMEFALLVGVIGSMAPGYYFRSRLGYFDTDMGTLLLPLLVAWLAAFWLRPLVYEDWRLAWRSLAGKDSQEPVEPGPGSDVPVRLWVMVLAGLVARFALVWHDRAALFNGFVFVALAGLGLLCAKRGFRSLALLGASVFGLAAFFPWSVGVCVLAAVLVQRFVPIQLPSWSTRSLWPVAVACAAVFFMADVFGGALHDLLRLVGQYAKPVAEQASASSGHVYPAVVQSIIEAANLSIYDIMKRLHPWVWVALVGFSGFAAVLVFRPLAVFLIPFGVICLASFKLGTRMSMFGGPVFALGLALPALWLIRPLANKVRWGSAAVWTAGVAATVCLAAPLASMVASMPATPVLSKEHAAALTQLSSIAPKESMAWTWWDYGYAANYYAECNSFADGARHDGRYVFTLGSAFSVALPRYSNQIIKYSAMHGYKPWTVWDSQTKPQFMEILYELAAVDLDMHAQEPQYLVVSAELVKLMPWVTFFGTWDFEEHSGVHGQVMVLDDSVAFNPELGLIRKRNQELPLKTLDIFDAKGRKSAVFEHESALHGIFFQHQSFFMLMDSLVYGSMAVQLLIADPDSEGFRKRFSPYFKLVYDDFPHARIYQVL